MNFDFSKQRNMVIFTTGRKKEWINVGDILYITVDLTLSSVFVLQKDTLYYFVKQLKEFETDLKDYGFFRVNGKTLVNGCYVKSLEKENKKNIIQLQNGKQIHLSRRQYSQIRKLIKS
ncbi:MAG: LytTR family transcriptional regulator [Bacteroidales bacterium]|jgi:DNA-binding LytR/AlgR family response regulator|nr:LytTR family transcriptional regulator [Bacteroidales bacterium]